MLRHLLYCSFLLLLIASCGENNDQNSIAESAKPNTADQPERPSFFPVTDYLKGQIKLMKTSTINPLLHTKIGNQEDSCQIRIEAIDSVLKDFIEPVIDSVHLSPYFKENKFEDATLALITLSYDAQKTIPENIPWNRWDIYIDPTSGEIKRVFMVRTDENGDSKQLLFKAGEYWKITSISGGSDAKIISEKTLMLKYDSR